jgi:hypothetical protein
MFKIKICLCTKINFFVQIWVLFICKTVQIIFVQIQIFVHIPIFFKFGNCSVVRISRSENIWIKKQQKEKRKKRNSYFLLGLTGAAYEGWTSSRSKSHMRRTGYSSSQRKVHCVTECLAKSRLEGGSIFGPNARRPMAQCPD